MAPRELSQWQLLPAWKREIIAHGYRLLWPAQTTASIQEMSAEQILYEVANKETILA